MKPLNWHYSRPELAEKYLKMVGLGPVFRIALLGVRRVGKTAFLIKDVVPTSIKLGFHPIYINLWDNLEAPHETIISVLNSHIDALSSSTKVSLKNLYRSEVRKFELNAGFAKAIIDTSVSKPKLITPSHITQISEALEKLNKLSNATEKRLLFIFDECQHLNTNIDFISIQSCLRTNFDTYHETSVIFAGSSRGGVAAMFNNKSVGFKLERGEVTTIDMPFFNSVNLKEFPLLDSQFINYQINLAKESFNLDSMDQIARFEQCFEAYDFSPFWFRRLLEKLISRTMSLDDAHEYIMSSIREFSGVDDIIKSMNMIDKLVYARIYNSVQPLSSESVGLYIQQMEESGDKNLNPQKVKNSATSSLRKLIRKKIVTVHQNEYFFEITGLYAAIKDDLKKCGVTLTK